ncbi:hypothetical protein ACP4OV_008993 [Aristida adscensionis]
MEEGSVSVEKASSCSVEEIELEMLVPSARENGKKLMKEGSANVRAEGAAVSSRLAGVTEEKVLGRSVEAMEKQTTRTEQNGSYTSWVVDMKQQLEHANPEAEMARWKQRCIYRAPEWMKEITNSKAYRPWLVSLGPFHHGERHLLPMEEHKRRAVLHLVKRSGKPLEAFVAAIEEVADELQAAYEDLDDQWRGANKGRFVELMVTDGCFLLELLRMIVLGPRRYSMAEDDYAPNDPLFSAHFSTLWCKFRNDMIALENQLPLVVLQIIYTVQYGGCLDARSINAMVLCLLGGEHTEDMDSLGLHFLDIFHKSYCGTCPALERSDDYELRTPFATELSDAGIQFEKTNTESIHDIDFVNGVLSIPMFEVYDSTEIIYLNMMAFEWLHPGTEWDVGFYINFMDGIIESESDAALLRSKGILGNFVGSDKKVVELFSTLTKLTKAPRKGSKLGHVQWKLKAHCRKRRNRWRAIFVKNYLSNPWVFISLVAAVILLIATLLQTCYTIVPFYTRKG